MQLDPDIVALEHNLGKKVIAEGVETPEQLGLLRSLGCDYGQVIGLPSRWNIQLPRLSLMQTRDGRDSPSALFGTSFTDYGYV